ncbi:hypothetical protein ACP70R_013830 [Stipagrostis hirtigluma subsp. patula]
MSKTMVCVAAGVGGGLNGGEEEEEGPTILKLPPMVKAKQDPFTPSRLLEVTLTRPEMTGYAGPAWPEFCFLHACVGDVCYGSAMLPFERKDAFRNGWGLPLMIPLPVESSWPHMSLDLLVERVDIDPSRTNLIRGGPHTSGYYAVIGRARVRLLDALVIGDDDEEEEEEEMEDEKRRRYDEEEHRYPGVMEGTQVFDKTVLLNDWMLPALRGVGAEPRCVVRGTVHVHMCLRWGLVRAGASC